MEVLTVIRHDDYDLQGLAWPLAQRYSRNVLACSLRGDHVGASTSESAVEGGLPRDHVRWVEGCQGIIMVQHRGLGRWLSS
jgi:hypothetical protein